MQNQRQFLGTILPACSFACFGLGNSSLTAFGARKDLTSIEKHKFQLDWTHTDEDFMADARNDEDFNFTRWLEGGNVYKNMMSEEIVELTDRTYEMKVTECLWSKIFIEYDAADIGYATVCYSDFASARATHPKLRLERTKTIMEGHGYCDHRWILDI